jgi:response regulator RpfG family c-di-GMP phosphodiesterase
MSAHATQRTKVIDLLHRAQVLPRPQYERALALLSTTDERGEDVLVDNDLLSEADLLKALSAIYRTHFVSAEKLSKADIPRATVQMIPRRVAETFGVFPVLFDPKTNVLSVVTADPENAETLREIKLVSGAREVKAFVARPSAVAAAIRKHHGGDTRAFERFERERAVGFSFGVQMGADGRVTSRTANEEPFEIDRTSARKAAPEVERPSETAQRAAFPQSAPSLEAAPPARPAPELEAPKRPGIAALDDLDFEDVLEDAAPSLPQAPPKRANRAPDVSLSAPPPPNLATVTKKDTLHPPESISSQNDNTIELLTVLVSLLENARQELRGHSSQVARLLRRVAERMNLTNADTYAAVVAGLIHDLGKMGQFHLTALNSSEYEGHRHAAQKAFDTPLRLLEGVRMPPAVKHTVLHMYERFDGKGFPDKLDAKEIPLGARLLAVADTYADLTQNPRNPFRKVLGPAEAMEVLQKHSGTIFDPAILDLFKALVLGEDMKAKLLANRHRALVIDPDPEESTVLELRMVEQGFDVKIARTVEAARKLIAAGELDVVVSEIELPDGDGLALLADARKDSGGRDVAWIFHTQKQGRSEAQRAFDLGAMDFVAKPVQADVLVAKIKAMLEKRSQSGKGGGAKGVSGSLREMGLPDIVQVLFHGRKTGKLSIKDGTNAGEIHFLEGAVANALLGSLSGADAFYAMVRFNDGEFALDPTFVPPKRVVTESAEALLLEGMRRMDEGI